MAKNDPYATLGVTAQATLDEVKAAYRKLAKKHHPDQNPGDKAAEAKFREVTDAYDTVRRRLEGKATADDDGFGASYGDPNSSFNEIFDNIFRTTAAGRHASYKVDPVFSFGFDDVLGGGTRGRAPGRGDDVERSVSVTLEDAFSGTSVVVDAGDPSEGKLRIKLPAGVEPGKKVRVKGRGVKGRNGGAAGDLIVTVDILAHSRFALNGQDLQVTYDVPFTLAASGGQIEYTHIDGKTHRVLVPAFHKSETVLVAKGDGWPGKDGASGDLLIKLRPVLPKSISEKQKKLLREFEALSGDKTYASPSLAKVLSVGA